jgi:hypothetical protein
MLSVICAKPFMLCVIKLNVIMLSAVAPHIEELPYHRLPFRWDLLAGQEYRLASPENEKKTFLSRLRSIDI